MTERNRFLAACAILLLIAGAAVAIVWPRNSRLADLTDNDVPLTNDKTSEVSKLGYVGWQTCAECHSKRVADFQETRHFHACEIATETPLSRVFLGAGSKFQPPGSHVHFDLFANGSQPLVKATTSEQTTTSSISYVYGAGAGTDEVFFVWHGDGLFELPVVWLEPQNRCGVSLLDPYAGGNFSRPMTPQCLECHTLWVEHRAGTSNQYVRPQAFQLGVTCERCHGPGHDHVEHHQTDRSDKSAHAIVHPGKLSRDRQMDLCAQCHSNAVRHRRAPFSYRPGEPLEESFRVLLPQFPEENRVADQTRYLKESRCFQHSETMTCITCHDPHRARRRDDPQAGSRTCAVCHSSDQCRAQPELPAGARDNCVGCHMPLRNKIQVNFETAEEVAAFPATRFEHQIGVYPEATQRVLYEWYSKQPDAESLKRCEELAARLATGYGETGLAARAEGRFLLAIDSFQTALRFGGSNELRSSLKETQLTMKQMNADWFEGQKLKRERRLAEAIALYEKQLLINPHLSKIHFELGSMYAATGNDALSIQHLRDSIRDDSEDPAPHAMLGWLDFLAGRFGESLAHYRNAAELESWSDRIQFQQCLCLLNLNRWEDALVSLRRTLTINPMHREAVAAARKLLRERFSAEQSLPQIKSLVEATRSRQPELLLTLAEIQHELGENDEANRSLLIAQERAENLPALLSQIRNLQRVIERSKAASSN